jgi:TolA-binding protein
MDNRNKTLIAILILLLLIVGAGLGYTLFEMKKLKTEYNTLEDKNSTVEELYAELESEYDRSLGQLEDLEGENAGLDSLLEIKKEELNASKAYIASLISNGSASKKELADARNLIAQLTNQRLSLQNAVDSLRNLNMELEMQNITILQEKEVIETNLQEVTEVATALDEENTDLKEEKNIASILSAKNMTAQGIKIKGNGKEVDVSKASGTRKLKICFDLLENKIAPEGPTRLYIRIIGPDGVTLALQSMGSGTFTEAESGQSMQYTYEIAPDFNKSGKSVCSYWDQNVAYASGSYQVEVYQKGYSIGNATFELR